MLFALQTVPPPLPLVPLPASVQRREGELPMGNGLSVSGGGDEGKTLVAELKEDGVKVGRNGAKVTLRTVPGMADEGYRLTVTPDGATIEATTAAGLFYGGQTLRQLVPPMGGIPAVTIEDAPRFAWRGMMLDVSRHFRPVADVERIIDLNARAKMNVFHWHLTDDGGWRMEIKAYPELTKQGAFRSYPPKGKWDYRNITFPAKPVDGEYGGFYTQKQIKEVIAFAAKRHVTIVPEIEMPGHEQAALQTYPWLACDGIPTGQQAVALCPAKETTYVFLKKVLDETMALFPSKFIHIGGDEVEKRDWNRSALCQALMQKEGLKNAEELQSYFVRQIDAYIASKGRRMIGWDEILEGGLAPGATVMSWRGIAGGVAAAKQGRDVVMSPTTHLYLDYSYDNIPTAKVYSYDPIPAELSPDEAKHVLGAQGNVWTEWLPDEKDIERQAYPRAAALAEAVWTPLAQKSWPDFNARLWGLMAVYDRLGVAYHAEPPVLERTAYLTDETVTVAPPTPRIGWNLRVDRVMGRITDDHLGDSWMSAVTPISLPLDGSATFAYVSRAGVATPSVTVHSSRGDRRDSTDGLAAGLLVSGKAGTFHHAMDFPGAAGVPTTTISLDARPAPEGFALRFRGYIRLPKDGDYAFALDSDDGSVLKIGGLTVVDNDGEHGAGAKRGTVWAKAGVYPFDLGYFDAGGANSLSLTVNGGPIPLGWLWH